MYNQSPQPMYPGPSPYGGGYPSAPPMNAPYPQYPQASQRSVWSTGLCGCADNCSSCWISCLFPCITFGRVAETIDEGRTTCCCHATIYTLLCGIGVPCLYSCMYRKKLRAMYNLPAEPCGDCCVHFCCECCALSQEHRELRNRGRNPAAGWVGAPMAPPPMPQAMYK
eukprot:Gb_37164 [translate_table: standard]